MMNLEETMMKHIKRLTIAGLTAVMLFTGVPYVQMTDTASPSIVTTKEVVHAAAKKLTKKQKLKLKEALVKERMEGRLLHFDGEYDDGCGAYVYSNFAFVDINGDGTKEMMLVYYNGNTSYECCYDMYDVSGELIFSEDGIECDFYDNGFIFTVHRFGDSWTFDNYFFFNKEMKNPEFIVALPIFQDMSDNVIAYYRSSDFSYSYPLGVGDVEITKSEYDKYRKKMLKRLGKKKDLKITWHPFTEENVKKYLG